MSEKGEENRNQKVKRCQDALNKARIHPQVLH